MTIDEVFEQLRAYEKANLGRKREQEEQLKEIEYLGKVNG